jgi:hypothetical protein
MGRCWKLQTVKREARTRGACPARAPARCNPSATLVRTCTGSGVAEVEKETAQEMAPYR